MIRKIAATALRPGMYIHDLGYSWIDHPFLRNRFLVRTTREIETILDAGIVEVAIDTARGAEPEHRAQPAGDASPTRAGPTGTPVACDANTRDRHAARRTALPGARESGTVAGSVTGGTDGAAPQSAVRAGGARSTPDADSGARRPEAVLPTQRSAARETPGVDPAQQATAAPSGSERDGAAAAQHARTSTPERIAKEFEEAKRVHAEACRVVHQILTDARLGRQVSIEHTHAAVKDMAESILHNPGPLLALCRIKRKDEYTFLHSVSIGALLMVFARAAGIEDATLREAGIGGLLHDIGKMKVPVEILNKPGPLTEAEVATMRTHVTAGTDMLSTIPGISDIALKVAAEHHERHDGAGYPLGLKGASISRFGQMAAIVDVYDAITSDRVYRRGLTPAEALKLLFDRGGSHFDPALVQLFIKTLGIYPAGSLVMLESGRLGIVVEQNEGNLLQPRVRVVYDTRKAAFVAPVDVDLARTAGHGGADRILRHESPQRWSIDPLAYLLNNDA